MLSNRLVLAALCMLGLSGALAGAAATAPVSKPADDGGKQPVPQRMTHVEERMQAAEARILALQQKLGETVYALQDLDKRHKALIAKFEAHQHAMPLTLWSPPPGYPLEKITFVIAQGKSSGLVTRPVSGSHN
jgi:hypothetical protein